MNSLTLPLPSAHQRLAFGKIALNEARLAWRLPVGLIGGIGLPVILLVIFGELPAFQKSSASLGGLTAFDVYVPIVIVFGLASLALWGVPSPLVNYREQGILRRLSTTPVPPSWLLAAQVLIHLCVAVAGLGLVIALSVIAFGSPAPKNPGGLALSYLLASGGLFAIGLVVAAVARSATGASVIGRLTFFPLIFFAGLWLPRQIMPSVLLDISNYTPLGAAVEAVQDSVQGQFPPATPLLVMAGYAVAFGLLAWRLFRWE